MSSERGFGTDLPFTSLVAGANVTLTPDIVNRAISIAASGGGGGGLHAATHQDGGIDEVNVANLSGILADPQFPIIGAGANQAVAGNDSRLTDARVPLAHTHPENEIVNLVTDLAAKVPTARTVSTTSPLQGGGNLSANLILSILDATTSAKGIVELATDGENAAGVVVQGNDSRLSNSRNPLAHHVSHENGGTDQISVAGLTGLLTTAQTPIAHKATHQSGGTDSIALDTLAATTDIATLNASTAAHGLLPKLNNVATNYLDGTGAWSTPNPFLSITLQVADLTNATLTLSNTDMVFTYVANSVYIIDLYLVCTSVATTTGYSFAFDVSSAVTQVSLFFVHALAAGSATITATNSSGFSIADATRSGISSGVPTAGALVPLMGVGLLITGANGGTCRLQFAPEVAASATLKANSCMRVHKVV